MGGPMAVWTLGVAPHHCVLCDSAWVIRLALGLHPCIRHSMLQTGVVAPAVVVIPARGVDLGCWFC